MNKIKVGILYSLSGTMAMSATPLLEATLMAIAEINAQGGILGHEIEAVIEDGASDIFVFENKARKLLEIDQVATVFGCWTSTSRKAVKPLMEEFNVLLWYPVQYEGLECSPNIFYTGSCLNQQIQPAVSWSLKNLGKRFYLLGSDYVFPRTAHKLIKSLLKQEGGTVIGEQYFALGNRKFSDIIDEIKQLKPNVIFNTLNGDSNFDFYQAYYEAGIQPSELPIMAVSISESEVHNMVQAGVGHYACWSYFQSLNTPHNQEFVNNFKALHGIERVTSDPIEASYFQVYLWKQSVETANSFETDAVRKAAYHQTFPAPGGVVKIEANHHLWKNCYIGQITKNGQFEIVWKSPSLIKPLPWLGVEELKNFPQADLVIDMLAEVSQGIQHSCLLEANSRRLELTMKQLKTEIEERQRIEITLKEVNLELKYMAITDSLTKLANRYWFNECLKSLWNQHLVNQTSLALILCDIDYFKNYNDTYGHQKGDDCLQEVAQAIKKAVRNGFDIVARYGGEEFAVILPQTALFDASQVATRINIEVQQLQIPHLTSLAEPYVTVSLGVSSQIPTLISSPELLISESDKALYKAKNNGKNQWCLHYTSEQGTGGKRETQV
ncbi:putative Diguanylate cyclase [Planktothrix serta PCC 8927]|uniref:Diguanylate cyclase n=1 Tax=Planktothrix serta PCC 8927 TaxID=671068 RepID=A0A7Z9C0I6_9CYAN|nr:transporter substrate-binding protein [Planktothrix serta]VXD25512.1 putative Diguanylate cyclase [Planktothrix serta PCC 8927]